MTERPPLHPACAAYPPMPETVFKEFVADIRANGQRDTIVMITGMILDGRMRWDGCTEAGIEPRVREFGSDPSDGDDPVRFVLSKNQHRRHMTQAERIFTGEAMATLLLGSNQYSKEGIAIAISSDKNAKSSNSIAEVAAALDISVTSINDARAVRKYVPDLVEPVKAKQLALRRASEIGRQRVGKGRSTAAEDGSLSKEQRQRGRPPAAPRIDPPVMRLEVATAEETGRPPDDAPLADHLAWRDKIGAKVPLFSVTGKQLLEDRSVTEDCAVIVTRLVNFPETAENLQQRIGRMLMHVPKPESKSGEQFDFAKSARAVLRTLKQIDAAIEKLTAYRDILAAPKD